MKNVRRVYVEKKKGFDVAAEHLFHDLTGYLGLSSIKGVRLFVRYDIEGLPDQEYAKALHTIFSEPPVDRVVEESLPLNADERLFAYEYLPGQYDQRADSAIQCLRMISGEKEGGAELIIKAAQAVVLKGKITDRDLSAVKQYLINPVDSHEAALEVPETLKDTLEQPDDVRILRGFNKLNKDGLESLRKELGLAMSAADIAFCQKYFREEEKRDPTLTEIRMLDTYWSDHCRHTTFLTRLTEVYFEPGEFNAPAEAAWRSYQEARGLVHGNQDKPVCLMDIALMGMRLLRKQGLLEDLEVSNEVNACSIVVPAVVNGRTQEWLVMFKNETHNHPTEIEPFGGAATCLGGAIRDPLSGRSYVYQAMRVTGAGDPRRTMAETMKGKLPQRKITVEAAHGYSSYGNQIGLATGIVSEIYHEGYTAKRMEIGAVIAAAPRANVLRGAPAVDDVVVLLGGRTGRDGCGGATGSSKEHNLDSIATCGAEVQKGNPPTERKIQRLFRNPQVSRMIKVCNDFGAGGVSVAIGELADGLFIDLDKIPKKYEGLDGTELAISESQERMAVLLDPKDQEAFILAARAENLEATPVARVIAEKRVTMAWRGKKIVDISRAFIDTNGVLQRADARVTAPDPKDNFFNRLPRKLSEAPLAEAWVRNLEDLNVCGQQGLVERFDSTIGAGTLLLPFGGACQATPMEAMAAKLPVMEGETGTGTLMSHGFDPDLSSWSPFHGAVYAILHSVARIVCAGGSRRRVRLTLQEYFEKLGNDPVRWGKPLSALLGAFTAQQGLGTPAIGGKDSMSGSFEDISVPPTLVSFAVCPVMAKSVISGEFKKAGHNVSLFRVPVQADGLPDFAKACALYDSITDMIEKGAIISAYTVGKGGIAAAITKMAFGNRIGFTFAKPFPRQDLFSPQYGAILAEMKDGAAFDAEGIGTTTDNPIISVEGLSLDIDGLFKAWEAPLNSVFPARAQDIHTPAPAASPAKPQGKRPSAKTTQPRICIPVFPGTNCEYDSARAFARAGGKPECFIIRNLTNKDITESLSGLAGLIRQSQIIMLPGGFSAGDEPDGSGKFITAVFRNPLIRDAVMDLLTKRDGLVLGICNGFQALIKLGLVPYGEIRDMAPDSPTLTFNTLGRHISRMVRTRVSSTLSPWLAGTKAGDVHAIAISHGEGRFFAPDETIRDLAAKGQVATQYCDEAGNPSGSALFNPNGSLYAIEGITSPDGRVLGKMGHSERMGAHVAKNIPGNKDQGIFESGVAYFS